MSEIRDYSVSPDPNTAQRWPEGMAMSAVNDTGRVDEGILARWYRDTRGDLLSTGSGGAYSVTPERDFTDVSTGYDGLEITFQANHTNDGAATLAAGAILATDIKDNSGGGDLIGGEIQSGSKVTVIHNGTNWVLTSAQSHVSHYPAVNFGAKGDGVTDDTAAIQEAIDTATANGGGIVTFRQGVYLASQITIKSNVLLDGNYWRNVTLKQIDNSNQDFVISENVATLIGSNLAAPTDPSVPVMFGLKDILIDGNKDNQTTGDGVKFYGSQMFMLGTVYVYRAKGNCIYTEGPDSAQATLEDIDSFEGGYFDDVICHHAGVYGWEFVGPHNSQIKSYRGILDDDGTSSYGWYSHNNGTAASGVLDYMLHTHIYSGSTNTTNRRGYWFAGGAGHIVNLMADAVNILIDTPTGLDTGFPSFEKIKLTNVGRNPTNLIGMQVNQDSIRVENLECTVSLATAGSAVGVQWDGNRGSVGRLRLNDPSGVAGNKGLATAATGNHFKDIYGQGWSGAGSIAVDFDGRECMLEGLLENNALGLDYAGITNNKMNLHITANAGQTHVTGTPTANDTLTIKGSGAAGIFYTERTILSPSFAVDSTGVKTVTVAHGALFQPTAKQVQATFALSTSTTVNWDGVVTIDSIDATNIVFKVNITTASATGGATCQLAVSYDVRGH